MKKKNPKLNTPPFPPRPDVVQAVRRRPFRGFIVTTTDGKKHKVTNEFHALCNDNGSILILYENGTTAITIFGDQIAGVAVVPGK